MPLTSFGRDIWISDGPTIDGAAGFHFPTRMAVMRLPDNSLIIWSPVVLTDDLAHDIDALGTVKHLIAPNDLHHMALPDWAKAYPAATLHGAPGVRDKQPALTFAPDVTDTAPPIWADHLDQAVLKTRITTEVIFFHRSSGTAIFTDLLQNMPRGWFSGWRGIVAKLDLMTGPIPQVPRKFRVSVTDKRAARHSLAKITAWPVRQVLMAHGTPVRSDGATFLKNAFGWLIR